MARPGAKTLSSDDGRYIKQNAHACCAVCTPNYSILHRDKKKGLFPVKWDQVFVLLEQNWKILTSGWRCERTKGHESVAFLRKRKNEYIFVCRTVFYKLNEISSSRLSACVFFVRVYWMGNAAVFRRRGWILCVCVDNEIEKRVVTAAGYGFGKRKKTQKHPETARNCYRKLKVNRI